MDNVLLLNGECCLCTKNFINPRYMPSCLHTFCLKCIEAAGKMNGYSTGENLPCPVCGIESLIPPEGFVKLPENLFVADVKEGAIEEYVGKICEVCSKKGDREGFEEIVAENYCINCERNLCVACTGEHEKNNHLLVRMTRIDSVDKTTEEQKVSNNKRNLEEAEEVFCNTCKEIVCGHCLQEPHSATCTTRMHKNKRICTDGEEKNEEKEQNELGTEAENIRGAATNIEDHSSHNFSKLNDCSVIFRKMAEINNNKVSEMIADFQRKRTKVHRERMNFLEQVKKIEIQILKRSEEMKEVICNEARKLLTELSTLKRARLAEIDTERQNMEKHLSTLEMFKKFCNEINNTGSDREVCRMDDTLQSTLNRMRNNHASRIQYKILPLQLSFSTIEMENFIQPDKNIVGCIEVISPISLQLASIIHQNLGRGDLRGISKLQDKLYVLSNEITVFQSHRPFTRLGEIKLQEDSDPVDITSCQKSSCLYVSDKTSACVWKITNDHRVIRWMSKNTESYSLSVCQSGQVVMIEGNEGKSSFYLNIYETNARHSHRIPLPQELKSVRCIYEAPSGTFFIGYGIDDIFKLTMDGQLLIRQKVHDVRCLQMADYHMLLGKGNSEVLVLDSKFAMQKVPYDHNQSLDGLTKMCYIPETKQLAVLHDRYGNQKMYVYNILARK